MCLLTCLSSDSYPLIPIPIPILIPKRGSVDVTGHATGDLSWHERVGVCVQVCKLGCRRRLVSIELAEDYQNTSRSGSKS
jgi:hypothetical protein